MVLILNVNSAMFTKISGPRKVFIAYLAVVWLLSCVDHVVFLQTSRIGTAISQGCNWVSKFHLVSIRYQIDTKKIKKRYLLDTNHTDIRYQKQRNAQFLLKFYMNIRTLKNESKLGLSCAKLNIRSVRGVYKVWMDFLVWIHY